MSSGVIRGALFSLGLPCSVAPDLANGGQCELLQHRMCTLTGLSDVDFRHISDQIIEMKYRTLYCTASITRKGMQCV